jgi:hypothetical protein
MPNDLGEVTANYPVGALTKGKNLKNLEDGGSNTDTLDFMLKQFRQDYIANADTEPTDLPRTTLPAQQTQKRRGPLDLLMQMPPSILIVLSLGAGGGVAIFIVILAVVALRYLP